MGFESDNFSNVLLNWWKWPALLIQLAKPPHISDMGVCYDLDNNISRREELPPESTEMNRVELLVSISNFYTCEVTSERF